MFDTVAFINIWDDPDTFVINKLFNVLFVEVKLETVKFVKLDENAWTDEILKLPGTHKFCIVPLYAVTSPPTFTFLAIPIPPNIVIAPPDVGLVELVVFKKLMGLLNETLLSSKVACEYDCNAFVPLPIIILFGVKEVVPVPP